ncbi:hypothetical protein CEJ45_21680 [Herbaspirillum aquaticum]|uniref:Uncharacterized protein n=1 Tax=Herbaspirillum aquaticum TaxID=568783 RepID=A0A225SNK9_9BURK|nr:hypothetical protein CEJ45_21680 [Herbaspirillum aquaticum]
MFLDLKELGYKGSYDRVAAFGRRWKVGQMERVNSASKSTTSHQGVIFETQDRMTKKREPYRLSFFIYYDYSFSRE